MRAGVLRIFIVAMLFMSVEGAAETVDDAHFHQTHHAHADDANNQWFPDSDGSGHEGESCEHFCHAHVVVLTTQIVLPGVPKLGHYMPALPAYAVSRSPEPPTPPPNI